MAEGDGAAVYIELAQVEAEVVSHCHGLGGKGFIRFDQVKIADLHAGLFQDLSGGRNRADAHDGGFYARQLSGNPGGHGGDAQLLRLLFAHDDDGCRAVVDAGSVSCGHKSAVLLKGGAQLGKAFYGYALAGAFVRIHNDGGLFGLYLDGNDLFLKTSLIHGLFAFLLAVGRELVQLLAGQTPLLADIFRGHSHMIAVKRIGERVL